MLSQIRPAILLFVLLTVLTGLVSEVKALRAGLGLPDLPLPQGLNVELMERIGRLLREATQGTLDLLLARAATKREVRAELTVISARGNNPLKFSPDVALASSPGDAMFASLCYLVTQVARMGTIMYLLALPMNALLGWPIPLIIVVTGVGTLLYSLMGGIVYLSLIHI